MDQLRWLVAGAEEDELSRKCIRDVPELARPASKRFAYKVRWLDTSSNETFQFHVSPRRTHVEWLGR